MSWAESDSSGTDLPRDHGTAAPILLAGADCFGGFGDLSVSARNVVPSILERIDAVCQERQRYMKGDSKQRKRGQT